MINGVYYVADCEHRGDIEREVNYLRNIDREIVINSTYWDGHDCGEAYIKFSFPKSKFVSIYEKVDAYFDADINDYLDFSKNKENLSFENVSIIPYKEFKKMKQEYCYKFTDNIITLDLFFEKNNRISDNEIISKALEAIGDKTEILSISYSKTDGTTYVSVLFKTEYDKLDYNKIREYGDFCIGGRGWLSDNRIYGELKVNTLFRRNYENLWNKVRNKEPLPYKKMDGGYYVKPILVEYNDYIENSIIKDRVKLNDIEYYLFIR